ncbi:PAP2 superfamily-domain-containing protein [Penicillium sp. IBT 18751x]|nr:PAP2 superfamily-domain-containing protein [Penicillium sp. IBT 18751x]
MSPDDTQVYQCARTISARLIVGPGSVFREAERHPARVPSFEHHIGLDVELFVQQFVLNKVSIIDETTCPRLTFPYCYRSCRIRLTSGLENGIAFVVTSLWRCSTPRLLAEEYAFIDELDIKQFRCRMDTQQLSAEDSGDTLIVFWQLRADSVLPVEIQPSRALPKCGSALADDHDTDGNRDRSSFRSRCHVRHGGGNSDRTAFQSDDGGVAVSEEGVADGYRTRKTWGELT